MEEDDESFLLKICCFCWYILVHLICVPLDVDGSFVWDMGD